MTITYSIQNNFPLHKLDADRLSLEIRSSAITVSLNSVSTSGDTCSVDFRADISSGEVTVLDAIVAAHQAVPLTGAPSSVTVAGGTVVTVKPTDARVTTITHDWTDPTTWYQGSTYVADETATDSGNHILYTLAHPNVIDVYHGKLSDEDFLKDSSARNYRVVVKVNGTAKTERNPHYATAQTGEHHTVDYVAGTVTFLTALDPADVVTVTYHYAVSSVFTVKPSTGKKLSLGLVEVQFSADVVPSDTVRFQAYGYVQSFAPQYCPTPYPLNTKIPLGNPTLYKGIKDFMNGSVRSYPNYGALGAAAGWRGISQPTVVMDWDYTATTLIDDTKGMEIRLSLDHNTPWGGTFATATFYSTEA